MRVGIILGDAPTSMDPREHVDLVRRQVAAGQEAGCRAFVLGQHFVYGDIRWPQPVPLLASLASELDPETVVGPLVLVAPLYPPVLLAEELATLDMILGGRLVVGLGAGYRQAEFDAFGIPFDQRIERLEEMVPLVRRLWHEDEVDHTGAHYHLHGARPHVRPTTPQGPPVWMGAKTPAGVRRAARIGDVWAVPPKLPFDGLLDRAELYRIERERLGLAIHPVALRREIVLGDDASDAAERYVRMTDQRLDAYVARELVVDDPVIGETRDPRLTALLGTPEQCIEQMRGVTDHVAVDPLLFRAAWPGMSIDEVERYIHDLGQRVLSGLRELPGGKGHP